MFNLVLLVSFEEIKNISLKMEITIPDPDFNFSDVAYNKVADTVWNYLSANEVEGIIGGNDEHKENLFFKIDKDLNSLFNKEDKYIYISQFFISLSKSLMDARLRLTYENYNIEVESLFKEIRYFLYNKLNQLGVTTATGAFTSAEVAELNKKIDSVISTLETLKTGQQVIFEHIDDVIEDYDSLKSDYIIGKKRWYQRAAGIIVSYAGEKGADALYETIKPALSTLMKHTPDIIYNLLK